ncbi:MAG: hypothetical protein V2A73_04380 [Pseudomonadota bacterium]
MTHRIQAALIVLTSCQLLLSGCATRSARIAPFRARPDSVAAGNLKGPFDGQVVDVETGRPIGGAMICGTWELAEGTVFPIPAGSIEHVTKSDPNGFYRVPRLEEVGKAGERHGRSSSAQVAAFILTVYKRGYVAYRSDRRFEDFSTRTELSQRFNQVRMARWRSDVSHVRHLRYLGGSTVLQKLTAWEVVAAAHELGGSEEQMQTGAAPRAQLPTPGYEPMAKKLLKPEDVKAVTGFEGTFEQKTLDDQPGSAQYDNTHLRAIDLPEAYDVALRVWTVGLGEAQQHYGRLLAELPNAQERNELGDRSLRATSAEGDILAVGFLDGRRGTVVLLTCGVSQCRSHDIVLQISRTVKDRLDAMQGASDGE